MWKETRAAEQIEADALEAATNEAAETKRLFLEGKYPGLCDGAYTDQCPHPVKHVLSDDWKSRYCR